MDIPVGKIVESCFELKNFSFSKRVQELSDRGFSGYIVLTVEGCVGFEEGLILLRQGEIIGCVFDFLKIGEMYYGDDALRLLLNSSKSNYGVADIIELSRQQAELVLAFNDRMAFSKSVNAKDLSKLTPSNYEVSLVKLFVGEKIKIEESRFDVIKRFGLKGL